MAELFAKIATLSHQIFFQILEVFLCKFIYGEAIARGTLRRKYFPVYFGKYFRTAFLQNTLGRLLLYVLEHGSII